MTMKPDMTRPTGRPDLDELLKNAVAAFKALPPEQQAAMLKQQAESWARSCVQQPGDSRAEPAKATMPTPTALTPTALTPEALTAALDRLDLRSVMRDVEPRTDDWWAVVDIKAPKNRDRLGGDIVSQHPTYAEARVAMMKAAIEMATAPLNEEPATGRVAAMARTGEAILSRMAEGCRSASSPCGHQKRDPFTLCEICNGG